MSIDEAIASYNASRRAGSEDVEQRSLTSTRLAHERGQLPRLDPTVYAIKQSPRPAFDFDIIRDVLPENI